MKAKDYIILASIFMVMAILFFYFDIAIPCIFNKITGLYCPGCGITRLVLSLLHGKIYAAFRYNPLVFIEVPIILICILIEKMYGKKYPKLKRKVNIIYIILLSITIVFGILRNIPQLSFLAPTDI